MRIGLIGLGGMGRGLAKNIAANGADLTVTDLDAARVEAAVKAGAKVPRRYTRRSHYCVGCAR